jgi:hypothetical protein
LRNFTRDFFEPIAFLIYLGVFAYYARRWQRVPKYGVVAGYYLVAACLMFAAANMVVNTHLYNVLYLLTAIGLGYYFFSLLGSRTERGVVVLKVTVVIIYFILSAAFGWDVYLDSRGHALTSLMLLGMMFMYYRQFMRDVRDDSISVNFDFWFVSSQLLYQMGSFGIFLSYNYFTKKILPDGNYTAENRTILTNLWIVHNVLLFLSALITAASLLWKVYRRKLP